MAQEKELLWTNWNSTGMIGGCETFFSTLQKGFGGRVVGYDTAMTTLKITPPQQSYYRNANIDRSLWIAQYLEEIEKNFGDKRIVANDDIGLFFHRLRSKKAFIMQNPYKWIAEKLYAKKLYERNNFEEYAYIYPLAQRIGCRTGRVVCVSDYMRGYAEDVGVDCDRVIRHGVDVDFWTPVSEEEKMFLRDKYAIPRDKKVIVSVTKFHPLKYALLHPMVMEFKQYHWIVVFSSVNVQKIRSDHVTFGVNLPKDVMRELYRCADAFFLPSFCESFNLSAVEAAGCGIPFITTRTGIFGGEIPTSEGGVVIEPELVDCRNALNTFFDGSYDARKWVLDNKLTTDRMLGEYKEFFDEVFAE